MLSEAIDTMYRYNHWATKRLLDVSADLTPEQLNKPGNAGRGSIRETFVHLISVQKRWLLWWNGSMPLEEALAWNVDLDAYPDLAAVRAYWDEIEVQTARFVDGLSEADIERIFEVDLPWGLPSTTFTLWQMMLHVANHGTQHRSEIAAMLTAADHSPGDIDLLFYFFEQLRPAPAGEPG